MPHITAAMSLNDGLATPVPRSFAPQQLGMELSRFSYKKIQPKFGWVNADIKWSDSTPKRPTVRQEISIEFPIVRNLAGVDTRQSVARAILTYVIPDDMTEDEVKDLRAFMTNLNNRTDVTVGTTLREPFWG